MIHQDSSLYIAMQEYEDVSMKELEEPLAWLGGGFSSFSSFSSEDEA